MAYCEQHFWIILQGWVAGATLRVMIAPANTHRRLMRLRFSGRPHPKALRQYEALW